MLKGALAELAVGNPGRLGTDIGPVITEDARTAIEAHVEAMRSAGHEVHRATLPAACAGGTFVAPTIIQIPSISALDREVFGPVLHVVRFRRGEMDALLDQVNGTGYALTFGIHTRIGGTIEDAVSRARAGNIYVNRNVVGAVVGVQPFGGHGLSGTGPKAGGPLYLRRLLAEAPADAGLPGADAAAVKDWDARFGTTGACPAPFDVALALDGPVGEENLYRTEARGTVRCLATSGDALRQQVRAALSTGNRISVPVGHRGLLGELPGATLGWITEAETIVSGAVDAVLFEGDTADLLSLGKDLASLDGPIVPVLIARKDGTYPTEPLVRERSVSTNTTAAGGNANLMMIG